MAPKLNPDYSKMLSTPAPPADGPRKNAIESLQKQIEFHVGETKRLRYAQNSHAVVSCLPAELLAEVFLHIIESSLRDGNTRFVTGTFNFLRVCRHWNEVAIGFPQLWSLWAAGAAKAWPLFNSRSKDTPLLLTWRAQLPNSARDILMDPTIPKRIRRLDFSGTNEQLVYFLGVFDSSPPSNASSIRFQIPPYDEHESRAHLAHFLSSPFPKLSQLDLGNFLPDFSSSIFTTSSLTSLKLFLPYDKNNQTLSQFSQILQQHPNLRELDLSRGAIPLAESSSVPVPFTLPRLAKLRLYGMEAAILGFIDLIGMSSPLHDVAIRFGQGPKLTVSTLANTLKKILVAYYECQGLNHPRKVNHLTISYNSDKEHLVFNTWSYSAPISNLRSNLRLQFNGNYALAGNTMVEETLPLFPLDDIREFAAEGLVINGDGYRGIFQKMKDLSHLRLEKLDILPVLDALSSDEPHQETASKLEWLVLSHLDILFACEDKLLDVLKGRRDRDVGLKKLVVRSCRVHKVEYKSELRELVEKVKWDNTIAVGSDYEGTDDSLDTETLEDMLADYEFEKNYALYV